MHLSEVSGDTTSEIVFGGFNEKMVRYEDINWNETSMDNSWALTFSNLKIGSMALNGVYNGVLSGRPYIGLPIRTGLYYQFERAVMKLGICEVNLDEYNALVCESDQILSVLPNITFTVMNSINITIPPKNYIYQIQNNLYKLAIIPLMEDEIVFGTPFLSTVYLVLDYAQNNIGVVRNEDMQVAKSRLAFIVTFSIIGGITLLIIIILVIYCIKHKKRNAATPTNNGTNESFDIDTK
jgi:hypothetical protein